VSDVRAGLHGRVDAILAELGYAAELDGDGDWRIQTGSGPFMIVVDRENGDLVAFQTIRSIEGPLAEEAELMHMLLQLNVEATGAAFGAVTGRDADLLVLCSRVPADEVTRERVEALLADATRLSARLDELAEAWRPSS
jgi:Putative bacterial sensory transduction regulator